ncbi:FtsZ-interacting cell division protein ZipA [Paenibacillus sp. V4I3]|nr:FtsZ-interacting cell division protein ZipA [Paenibacillus sp. V4I3]
MVGAIILGIIALLIIVGLTFWVTKKAYSCKWDEEDND